MEILIGSKGIAETVVERTDTAYEVGSGSLLVYATPCMAALMEGAACEAIADCLTDDKTTVGIGLSLKHTAATPVGMEVRAEATITEFDGKIITYAIEAFDESEHKMLLSLLSQFYYYSEEKGGINQYDFNVAFNIEDRFYLGFTLGLYDMSYKRFTSYTEELNDDFGEDNGYYTLDNVYYEILRSYNHSLYIYFKHFNMN